MLRRLMRLNLTLVLWCSPALAAPHEYSPDKQSEETGESSESLDNNLSITPAPKLDPKRASTIPAMFYPYRQALSVRTGLMRDLSDDELETTLGFLYLLPSRRSPQIEVGASILSDGDGELQALIRWTKQEFTYFRPFYRAGLGLEVDPENQIPGLIELENYQIRGGLGCEYTFRRPISLRLDAELSLSTKAVNAYTSLGLTWAW